jgi:hypothetical protein
VEINIALVNDEPVGADDPKAATTPDLAQHFAETLDYPALRGIDASVEELHGKIGTSSNVAFRRAKWSGPTSLQPAVGESLALILTHKH